MLVHSIDSIDSLFDRFEPIPFFSSAINVLTFFDRIGIDCGAES